MALEDVSEYKVAISGVDHEGILQYGACEVPVVIFGREQRGKFYVCPFPEDDDLMTVGMSLLKGATFTFNDDETWVLTWPRESA